MGKLITRLKATTLVESLIAMVIIVISFGCGMMVYLNVNHSGGDSRQVEAWLVLNEYRQKTVSEKLFFDEEISQDGFILARNVSQYSGSVNLIVLSFSATTPAGKQLAGHKEILSPP